jgi:hypothetical protein
MQATFSPATISAPPELPGTGAAHHAGQKSEVKDIGWNATLPSGKTGSRLWLVSVYWLLVLNVNMGCDARVSIRCFGGLGTPSCLVDSREDLGNWRGGMEKVRAVFLPVPLPEKCQFLNGNELNVHRERQ